MPQQRHRLTAEADNGREILFVCDDDSCGRRLVLKRSGEYVVIDAGDPFALHSGSVGSIGHDASIDA